MTKDLLNEEIALYDRQIRLWGLEAQKRIKTALILVINLGAVGTEIAKNLVLGGVGSLTICDNHDVDEDDFCGGFYVSEGDLGLNRASCASSKLQELNPRVSLVVDTDDPLSKQPEWFAKFDLVVGTDLGGAEIAKINKAARDHLRAFYAAGLNGLWGYAFSDLLEHVATVRKEKGNVSLKIGEGPSFSKVVAVDQSQENGVFYEHITTKDVYTSFESTGSSGSSSRFAEVYNTPKKRRKVLPAFLLTLASLKGAIESPETLLVEAKRLAAVFQVPESILEGKEALAAEFLGQLGVQFAPTSAIVGGVVAQDIINWLGHKNKPINNFVVMEGREMSVNIYPI